MKNAKARRGYNFVCICCQRRGCAPIIFVGKARTGKIRRIKGPVPTVGPDLVPSPGSSGRQSTVRSLSVISTPALAAPVPVPVLCSPALAPAALSPALDSVARAPAPAVPTPCQCGKSAVIRCSGIFSVWHVFLVCT